MSPDTGHPGGELPIAGRPPAERADAARNRRRILATAEGIVAEYGIDGLSMDQVAAAAGVGVGTVYRRFGDLAGLAEAMTDEHERRLQHSFMRGPPPLGPGAPPVRRVRAFLHAYADVLDRYAPVMAVAETTTPANRYGGAYAVHRVHLATLISEASPESDAFFLADALLAPLSASLFLHQRRELGMGLDRIKSGLDALLAGLPEE